jgi:predicted restriction endonuclease
LEAAHIRPYGGDATNHVQNGILLRSDIHTLFDMRKIAINPINYKVLVAKSLKGTVYGKLNGEKVRLPLRLANRPNKGVLRRHLEECKLKSR